MNNVTTGEKKKPILIGKTRNFQKEPATIRADIILGDSLEVLKKIDPETTLFIVSIRLES